MLTRDEALKIAPLAAAYPPGHGQSYFCTKDVRSSFRAVELIFSEDPDLVEHG